MKSRKIHILTTNSHPNSFALVFPMLINKKRLMKRDLEFQVFNSLNDLDLFKCDIIFVDNKFFKFWWQKKEDDVYKFLKIAKKRIGTVLWFDTADSTGTPQFQVLAYVDGYYKNQILKDKRLYFKNFYRARIFSEYYHRKFNIADLHETGCECPLDPAQIEKIHVSWNSGLNDYGLYAGNYSLPGNIISKLRKYFPYLTGYTADFIRVDKKRPISITSRLSFRHTRNFVVYHRRLLMKKLEKLGVKTDFTNRMFYYNELKNAQISISPFGMGEVCYRDFETVMNGALLVKPDMGHVETWPDIYKNNETYIGCEWDFSNLEEILEGLLSDTQNLQHIAREAQRNYYYYLFGGGRIDF